MLGIESSIQLTTHNSYEVQSRSSSWTHTKRRMSSPMNTAIYYNNVGIAYLEKGDHEDALRMLKEAAQQLYTATLNHKTSVNSEAGKITETECDVSSKARYFPRQPLVSNTDSNTFLCSVPIFLSAKNSSGGCTQESAVVLYNMALTYHLNAISANSISKALQNAMTLFEMASNLSLQVDHSEQTSHIIMSSLNNLGLLHHEQGNYSRSHQYFEDLSVYISSLRTPTEIYIASERRAFLLNAMVLRNEAKGAAAA